MNLMIIILMFGVAVGCLAIAAAMAHAHFAAKHEKSIGNDHIPKSYGTFELNPGALMSRWGAHAPAHQSLDKVMMRPTWGIKAFGALICGLLIHVMTGENGEIFRTDTLSVLMTLGCIIYYVAFLMLYEVRYDAETLTSPGMFLIPKTHDWADFISIKQTDQVTYTLLFTSGKIKVRKFLVGMPTFLTFVTDVRALNKRL